MRLLRENFSILSIYLLINGTQSRIPNLFLRKYKIFRQKNFRFAYKHQLLLPATNFFLNTKYNESSIFDNNHSRNNDFLKHLACNLSRTGKIEKIKLSLNISNYMLLANSKFPIYQFYYNFSPYMQNITASSRSLNDTLAHLFQQTSLNIFGFRIQNVPALVQKHSRGKTGKYRLQWAYLKPHKRSAYMLTWLLKFIQLNSARTLTCKLFESLRPNIAENGINFILKLQRYSHNFVYKNYKKTLRHSIYLR